MKSAMLPSLRRQREAFIARGIVSRDQARKTGVYHDASEVIGELRDMLGETRSKAKRSKAAVSSSSDSDMTASSPCTRSKAQT